MNLQKFANLPDEFCIIISTLSKSMGLYKYLCAFDNR